VSSRRQSLIFPREHGAWGILLVPLITGAWIGVLTGGGGLVLAPLTIAVLTLFWLRTPVESLLGTTPIKARSDEERRLVLEVIGALATVSLCGLVWLFWRWRNLELLWIGFIAAVAFLLQTLMRRRWRTAAQIIGAAGLTAVGPSAYYVVTGKLDDTAGAIWFANLAFAANQIQYVQLRIHAAQAATPQQKWSAGRNFMLAQAILVALLIAGSTVGFLPQYTIVAFAPILYRGFSWFVTGFKPLAVHRLGKTELAFAILFGILLIFVFAAEKG
jgi:hypothetical protein